MKAVNLIPEKIRERQGRQKRLRIWIVVVSLTAMLVLGWSGLKYFYFRNEHSRYSRINQEYLKVQSDIQELVQQKDQLEEWRGRIVVLGQLSRYPEYVPLLRCLSANVPEGVYLEKVEVRYVGENDAARPKAEGHDRRISKSAKMFNVKQSIQGKEIPGSLLNGKEAEMPAESDPKESILCLTGWALSHEAVSDCMAALKGSGLFGRIDLQRSSKQSFQNGTRVGFELVCPILPAGSQSEVLHADLQEAENL